MRGQKKLLLYCEKRVIKGEKFFGTTLSPLLESLWKPYTVWQPPRAENSMDKGFFGHNQKIQPYIESFWRGIYREQFDTWPIVKVTGVRRTRNRVNASLLIFCARIGQPHENSADPYFIHLIQQNPIFLSNEFQGAARNTIPGWAGLS